MAGNVSNILASIEEDQPGGNGQKGQEELSRDGQKQRSYQRGRDQSLDERTRRGDDAEREDADDGEEEVLRVICGPLVCAQRFQRVCRVERGLERGD